MSRKQENLSMKSTSIVVAASALIAMPLYAEETEVTASPSSASASPADNALEFTMGFGYAQGFGDISAGRPSLTDQITAGGELQLGLGWRIDPHFMVGVYTTGGLQGTGNATSSGTIYTATAGVQGNYHFLPSNEWDPWIGLGAGWRGMWIDRDVGGTDSLHGIDLARLTAGVDYRVNSRFAVSPYVGVGLTTFLSQELAGQGGFSSVPGNDVNVWVSAGIQTRFDLFGREGPAVRLASAN
jgi:hypothetical protein